MSVSRRLVMQGMMGLVAAAAARPAVASTGGRRRKVIFVFANGGWDPLSVFAPIFDSPEIDGNGGGERAKVGGIPFVDHPDRPSVRAFFEQWHGSTAILNGISVPSLSHEVCTRLMWTGQSGEGRPDWPSTVGASASADYTLPSLVISGPSFPDANGVYTARVGTNGQLADLIDGSILGHRPQGATLLPDALGSLIEGRVADRAAARAAHDPLSAQFAVALERARALGGVERLDFRSTAFFEDRSALAVEAIRRGVARSVTLEADQIWDTHSANDGTQSFLFEFLFQGLSALLADLGDLLDETTVVVLSEMGRTPKRNADDGRDHWPFTSAMLIGAGVRGDQVISGFDDGYFGLGYDPATGATGPDPLTPEHLGATLLASCDIDPKDHLPAEVAPIAAVLA